MNRRDMFKAVAVAPMAEMPERKRKLLWFRGRVGEEDWDKGGAPHWRERGECFIRMGADSLSGGGDR